MITKEEMRTIDEVATILEDIHKTYLRHNPPEDAMIELPMSVWASLYTSYMKLWNEAHRPVEKECCGGCDDNTGC